ncbi:MAG: Gfo/Idh/MocA family oxidoreductase [Verrucomicrobia bacterium]|nr:Gfo/Idh/MocA family oxidoreductase [Verrucomicrobiota bacterium]
MSQAADGMNYDPQGQAKAVVDKGEFPFAVAYLDHGHINGMTGALQNAGGDLRTIYDTDPQRAAHFKSQFPDVEIVDDFNRILDDPAIKMVAAAAIPNERCGIGLQVLDAGKDYFSDKAPFTSLDQLAQARQRVQKTGQKYMVYFSERLHNAPTYCAGELVRQGAIGKLIQILVTAPHRLSKDKRPDWFFDKSRYGGILTDIGCHQFEQFLYYGKTTKAEVNFARVENFNNPDQPGLEDFGETSLTLDTGVSCYCRIDWFTPDAARAWGDGRLFALGTEGYIEVRKYLDVGHPGNQPSVFLVNHEEERVITFEGPQNFPFFGELILDCLNRTENAMSQEHAFSSAELSLLAQQMADGKLIP